MARVGRNDLCPCGSGHKFKKCCASKTGSAGPSRLWMIVVGLAIAGALVVALTSSRRGSTDRGSADRVRVWDPAHGHYHDENGVRVP